MMNPQRKSILRKQQIMAAVFDNTAVGICLTDELGRFVEVNRSYCQIYGYERDELIGQTFTIVVPDEEQKHAQDLHDRFIKGEPEMPMEWVVRRKDGQRLHVITTAALMVDENQNKYKITTVNDISHQKRMQEGLEAAASIQNGLMPRKSPDIQGYSIAGLSVPSEEVGGDYFDFLKLEDDRLAFCLGDVSGKGMSAALLMSNLQAIIRGQAQLDRDPSRCLQMTNRHVFPSIPPNRFISLFYGILDPGNHDIFSANAGHLPPVFLTADDGVCHLPKGNLALGLRKNSEYLQHRTIMKPGDLIVAFSDGIVEAMQGEDTLYGEKRLLDIIKRYRHKTAAEICQAIKENVTEFINNGPQQDDLTVVIIKRLPE